MVSGALDRLHYERDPCVKYDSNRKVWIYLHRNRSEEEFGKIPGIYSIKRPPPISAHPFGRKRLIGTHPHTPPSAPPPPLKKIIEEDKMHIGYYFFIALSAYRRLTSTSRESGDVKQVFLVKFSKNVRKIKHFVNFVRSLRSSLVA